MGNIGDSMSGTPIPPVGSAGTGYATDDNAFMTEVKTRLEAQVPRGSLAPGNLDLQNSALQNAGYVSLHDPGSTPSTPASSLQQHSGDLYWVTNTGAAKITTGNALNAGSIGGITGDYGGANPAQFRFVDADQEYYAYDDFSGGAWARVWAKNFDIAAGATSANRVRLAYGGGGSYTLTFPTAAPAATNLVTMNSSGNFAADSVLGSNVNITMSGTGYIKRGARDRTIPLVAASAIVSAGSITVTGGTAGGQLQNSTTAYFPISGWDDLERINTIKIKNFGTGTGNITLDVLSGDDTLATTGSQLAAPVTVASGTGGYTTLTIQSPVAPWGGQSGRICYVKIVTAGTNTWQAVSVIVSSDVP